MTSGNVTIDNYRTFVKKLIQLSAGGPENTSDDVSTRQLINAIENNRLNTESLGNLLAGFPFKSFNKDNTE